jgi:hypothetical protein
MLKVYADGARYAMPFLVPLMIFTSLTLAGSLERFSAARWPAVLALIVATGLGTAHFLAGRHVEGPPRPVRILQILRAQSFDGEKLLAPQGDVSFLHYYFPHIVLKTYRDEVEKQSALASGKWDAVLTNDDPPQLIPAH